MFTQQRAFNTGDPSVVVRTKTWTQPLAWHHAAAEAKTRFLVFTCSWSDWFHEAADPWRDEAWSIVRRCRNLDFQILTKRDHRIADHLPKDWGAAGYPNVWLGVSIENDRHVYRADTLRKIPAAVRFLSLEPLLGPLPSLDLTGIGWCLVGGESGLGFRPMDHQWARDIRDRCAALDIPFFFKQSAALRHETGIELDGEVVRAYPVLPERDEVDIFTLTSD